jgi:hypothetical protein
MPGEEQQHLLQDRSSRPIPERAGCWISGKTGENDLKDLIGSLIKLANFL